MKVYVLLNKIPGYENKGPKIGNPEGRDDLISIFDIDPLFYDEYFAELDTERDAIPKWRPFGRAGFIRRLLTRRDDVYEANDVGHLKPMCNNCL